MASRSVTADLIIKEMCQLLYMKETELLEYLAVHAGAAMLDMPAQRRILTRAQLMNDAGIYVIEKED